MEITKTIELDYGHTLPAHFGFCSQLHGHRAKVLATVEGELNKVKGDSSQGMVLDFGVLKQVMVDRIHSFLDHGFAVWKDDTDDLAFIIKRNRRILITEEPPTAEYLAGWAFKQIVDYLPPELKLKQVVWYETPNSYATYTFNDWSKYAPKGQKTFKDFK
jgi:6-pyruvoyltetrahydropterin/6-carboxytetrahydropterin synthase